MYRERYGELECKGVQNSKERDADHEEQFKNVP